MLLSFLGLFSFLALAPRGALSLFEFVAYSRVEQCGLFNVSFSGGELPSALPLTLTILPFNSTPLAFTIPQSAWDNSTLSGSYATVLPLPAGVALIASLDDASGNSAALASDIFRIQSSTNTSCIATNNATTAPFRLVDGAVSQCTSFNVSRNTSSLGRPLSTRIFIPTGLSCELQSSAFHTNQSLETFTFVMDAAQGLRVALLFDDSQGNRQVSDLLDVRGGPSTSTGCLRASAVKTSSQVKGSSRNAIIAISVAAPITILLILTLGVFFIRRERRKLVSRLTEPFQNRESNAPSSRHDPPAVPPKSAETPARVTSSPVPVDPVYPAELFSSTGTRLPRSGRSTILAPFTPASLRSVKSRSSIGRSSTRTRNSTRGRIDTHPFVDLDIAGLLEMAAQQPAATEAPRGYPDASPHTVTPATSPSMPPSPSPSIPSVGSPPLSRERSYKEPDVPLSPLSRLSHEWRPTLPAEPPTVDMPREGLASRIKPLPVPSRSASTLTLTKNPVPF